MFPHYWNQTITVYHKIKTMDENRRTQIKWVRFVYKNCFYQANKSIKISDNISSKNDNNIIRIPYKSNILLNCGDIVIIGVVFDEIEDNKSGKYLLDLYDGFIVNEIKINNQTKRLKHIYGGG